MISTMNRFHGFVVVSALLVGAATVAVSLLAGSFFLRHMLAEGEAHTAAIVQSQARQHLTAEDFESSAAAQSARFRVFFDGLPGVFRVKAFDRTGRIVWANEPRLIGKTFPDSPYLLGALAGRVTSALDEPKRAEHVFERDTGYIVETYVPVAFSGSQQVVGVIETYTDMTAIVAGVRHTQRLIWTGTVTIGLLLYVLMVLVVRNATAGQRSALAGSEARFRSVAQFASDGIVLTDPGERIISWNKGAGMIFGYREAEVVGMPLVHLLAERDRSAQWPGLVARARSSGSANVVELHGRKKDGTQFPLEISLSTWKGGDAVCLSGIMRDITYRKHAELELRRSEERQALILRTVPMVVYAARADGWSATWLSENVEPLVGFPPSAFIEDTSFWTSRLHLEDRARAVTAHRELLETGRFATEYRWQCADGAYRWFLDQAVLVRDSAGGPEEIIGTWLDISRRKHAEEMLRQSEKLAAMGELLAGVAHELNNPLAVVMGSADLLHRAAGDGPMKERARTIVQAADRCHRIVRNFLALARQYPPESSPVRLNQIVTEAVELLAYPLRVADVEVVLDLADDLPGLWADPHQLHQVMVNLITNAHHAMRQSSAPRRITLATRSLSGQARVSLEVADTGPGIPEAIWARIFEPFFTTKPPGEGTGLGLSLCQGIVGGHGGSIRVENRPGQGAVFVVELPVEVPPAALPGLGETERPAPVLGKRILVVDDEPEVARVLADMLSADGHHVEAVTNGSMALEKLSGQAHDLIVCDFRMPGLDGPGLYQEVERRYPGRRPPFIFMTGDTLSPAVREFLGQVTSPSVSKPFVWDEVRRVVQQVLRG